MTVDNVVTAVCQDEEGDAIFLPCTTFSTLPTNPPQGHMSSGVEFGEELQTIFGALTRKKAIKKVNNMKG